MWIYYILYIFDLGINNSVEVWDSRNSIAFISVLAMMEKKRQYLLSV